MSISIFRSLEAEGHCASNQCQWHLCGKPLTGRKRRFCSPQCKNKFYVTRRRKALKKKAVDYKGGKCAVCGYDKCLEALSFHHSGDKEFGVSAKGYTRAWEAVRTEIDECLLVCNNCHAEIHADFHNPTIPV